MTDADPHPDPAPLAYAVVPPGPALARHIRCFWLLHGAAPTAPAGAEPERILPDGCCEIVLNRADPFAEVRGGGGAASLERQPSILLVGQMERYIEIAPTGDVDLIGIRFEPGGLRPLLGLSMAELTGRTLDLGDACAGLRRALAGAAAGPGPSRGRLPAIERALLGRLPAGPAGPPGPTAVTAAVSRIVRAGGLVRLPDVAQGVGISERQLERRFRDDVGLAPKVLARIVRFQRVLARAEGAGAGAGAGRRPDWAAIAAACGYSDQAHLIRDFGRFAGRSPGAWFGAAHDLAGFFTA